ncbi:MAG TPA: phosphomannomutase/phosphoglucomutase [Planctomycetes bacterium]|nr:phosphomannomutase/phosphoglucomutase [Planctomycetota bacterium]
MDPSIFRTDDIQGIYPDQLDEEGAWKIGHSTAKFLRSLLRGYERGQPNAQSLCVSRDMRTHSLSLSKALTEGMNASGANVIDIGLVDTPQMYFAINHLGTCGGVQVTASHNGPNYNGFKISGLGAKPIGADTGLKDIKHIATALLHTKARLTGSVEKYDLTKEYKNHVLKFLDSDLRRIKIVIDASNGMAGRVVPALFEDLPIDITGINFKHDGTFKHPPEPLVEANLVELKEVVLDKGADVGICFDGDADRMTVVDEQGRVVTCDILTAFMVPYFLEKHPNSTVVYDLRSSHVVQEEIIKYGGIPRRERVGHAFMKKTLRDSHAIFGSDLCGHFYYRDNFYVDSGMVTLVHILNVLSQSAEQLSELLRPLRRYSLSGELNFEVDDKSETMKALSRKYGEGQYDDLDGVTIQFKDWWFNARPSNTEPLLKLNVEAKTPQLLEDVLAELEDFLGKPVDY